MSKFVHGRPTVDGTLGPSEHSPAEDAPVLIHMADPLGWIALSVSDLERARDRAVALLSLNDLPAQTAPKEPRSLLTPAQAASILGVDTSWLLRAAREGTIPCVRLGRYPRFDPAAIIEHCTQKPRP